MFSAAAAKGAQARRRPAVLPLLLLRGFMVPDDEDDDAVYDESRVKRLMARSEAKMPTETRRAHQERSAPGSAILSSRCRGFWKSCWAEQEVEE
ncbi:hypothetical protein VTK73DRAFT_5083 [Phialemonium thermophilum]|uniref:Uncharacterized protein n=1 Tax=Phialemonium thermophilum TaxID=223376 RepID=A0ABR3V3S0_9PEZI